MSSDDTARRARRRISRRLIPYLFILYIIAFLDRVNVSYAALHAFLPSLWAIPTSFLTESTAAATTGLINSIGNLGGYLGPYVVGYVRAWTGSFAGGMLFLSFSMALAAVLTIRVRPANRTLIFAANEGEHQWTECL